LHAMREAAASSDSGEIVGRWLLGELLVPGGQAANAARARQKLDALRPKTSGMFASLARAVDDEAHGRFQSAAAAHLDALLAARASTHPDAPLVAWFAANHLLGLRGSVSGLWDKARDAVEQTIRTPGKIGWRARGELVGWWVTEAFRGDASPPPAPEPKLEDSERTDAAALPASADEEKDTPAPDPRALRTSGRRKPADAAAVLHGCIKKARIAGPFGHRVTIDNRKHFEAERPGPWPLVFPRDPRQKDAPRILPVERNGCLLRATEAAGAGIFYVETFIDLPAAREIIMSVQGALAVFIDDTEVLTRDTRQWGIWPRFGARVRLEGGRHRILARIGGSETSIRVVAPDGTPLGLAGSDDPTPPYALKAPERLPDPNALEPFLTALGVPPQPGVPSSPPRDVNDPIAVYLAAFLAHVESQEDVGSVLIDPLVRDVERATGPALAMKAIFVEQDPIYPETVARDEMKDLRAKAAAKDPELWWPRFWLALDEADKVGVPEVAPKLVALANHFREVPDIWKALAAVYGRMGWRAEHARAVKDTAARFPDDEGALTSLLQLLEEQGNIAEADKVAERLKKIDPDSEIDFDRAVARRDYRAAILELRKLAVRRADRKDIALRIADLLTRAGAAGAAPIQKLEEALKKKPEDAGARLALADARFASGDKGALRQALIDAIQTGSDDGRIREAIELLEGTSELSPFRREGRDTIREFEASGQTMPGTAARVLDYSAIWVHHDGSARMLEHEIIAIQSREAIQEHAEQRVPRGLVLKLRTVKRDGTTFEPEFVQGKPTVTMPHLEVGDYIETESLVSLRGDGEGGLRFQGPRWFFREEKLSYWLSEFVVVSPKSRPLQIETGGSVPPPQVTESGALVTRRWRVDKSPALPEEPASAPISEFLPNVRVAWGMSLDDTIERFIEAATDDTPRDPRLIRMAQEIVLGLATDEGAARKKTAKPPANGEEGGEENGGANGEEAGAEETESESEPVQSDPKPSVSSKKPARKLPLSARAPAIDKNLSVDEKARRIYRWVVANVEAGRENDGRRAVMGKSGNRTEAFLYLCRILGLDVSLGLVRDRLTAPSRGPLSEAESFNALALRLKTEAGPRWMLVRDKFAPYGYLPSALRGQPAVVLVPGGPRETTPSTGAEDGVTYAGTAELLADGWANLEIEQRYEGKLAIGLRSALESLPEARLRDTIESRLLPQALPGARLLSLNVKNLAELDAPLVLAMKIRAQGFALARGNELVIAPPFQLRLAGLGGLPVRETPLYISDQLSTRQVVRLRVTLPEGARVVTVLGKEPTRFVNDGRSVVVRDRVEGGVLILDRVIELPAGRVQPEAYADFQSFVRSADATLLREIVVALGSSSR
ncbi:MAG: hypothetical protein HUU21_35475, partial [Polyangiaceae bacterium]|nr:hypothetical protein [Polyangiaceae bacterium]